MKIYNIIRLAGFIGVWLFLLQSCKDEEQLNSKFEIEGTALQQSLDGNASTVVVQVKTTLPMSEVMRTGLKFIKRLIRKKDRL